MISVSIIIPTHNRAAALRRLLASLDAQQEAPPFEVVVVADGCTDGTEALLRQGGWRYPLRYRVQPASGAAAARNRGAAAAEGSCLIFLDDDIEAAPGLVAAHWSFIGTTERGVGLGYLPPVLALQRGRFRENLLAYWTGKSEALRSPGYRYGFRDLLSGNFSVSRSFFGEAGGFNEAFSCQEDYELGYRLLKRGGRFLFLPGAEGAHHDATDLPKALGRQRDEGAAAVAFCSAYPELIPEFGQLQAMAQGPGPFRFPALRRAGTGLLQAALPLLDRAGGQGLWTKVFNKLLYRSFGEGVRRAAGSQEGLQRILSGRTEPAAPMGVSVIIPAYNAAQLLPATLEGLLAQAHTAWEALVVNDGSTDGTAGVVAEYARRDTRIRLVQQENRGPSAARNTGLKEARYGWVLFLDADDPIAPQHLARMTGKAGEDPLTDIVICGYGDLSQDGTPGERYPPPAEGPMFPLFARYCAIAIHACIVRKALVAAVGGFDEELRSCEDWDLWQRIARTTDRFARVDEVLAFYRMRPQSLSRAVEPFLFASLEVLRRGHRPDPRVPHPLPRYRNGMPLRHLRRHQLGSFCYSAGLFIAQGRDPAPELRRLLPLERGVRLHPESMTQTILSAIGHATCTPAAGRAGLYRQFREPILAFLEHLGASAGDPSFARRAQTALSLTQ